MSLTDWISSVWDRSGIWGFICILLFFIATMNIGFSLLFTVNKMVDYLKNHQKNDIPVIIFLAFTIFGLYAAKWLFR